MQFQTATLKYALVYSFMLIAAKKKQFNKNASEPGLDSKNSPKKSQGGSKMDVLRAKDKVVLSNQNLLHTLLGPKFKSNLMF